MDEPASALDPIATQRIEELIFRLKQQYTIVIVTHNLQQAARVSDITAFFWLGRLVEAGPTDADLHEPCAEADRRLRHGSIRLEGRMPQEDRTSRHFTEELEALKERLLEWATWPRARVALPCSGLTAVTSALSRKSSTAIRSSTSSDRDRRSVLQAPGAAPADGKELRLIVAAAKITGDLERVGDLAVNVAEAARRYIRIPR